MECLLARDIAEENTASVKHGPHSVSTTIKVGI